jgi:hypothetical protein
MGAAYLLPPVPAELEVSGGLMCNLWDGFVW